MILFLDTHDRTLIRFASWQESGSIRVSECRGLREPLLSRLSDFLPQSSLKELIGICVVEGPGTFSAVRGGVLVANLLSRLYHIPLYGVSKNDAEDLEILRQRIASKKLPSRSYVAPVYDQEPNITKQKIENRK
jgi:tRNA A37 threonylcarbamoyladenosine modification protein TsaB